MPSPTPPQNARSEAPRAPERRRCLNCLKTFTKNRKWQKFCSSKCRDTHRNDEVRLSKIKENESNG